MAYNKGGCKEGKKMGKGGCKVGKKGGRRLAKEAKKRLPKKAVAKKAVDKKRPPIKMTSFRYYNTPSTYS